MHNSERIERLLEDGETFADSWRLRRNWANALTFLCGFADVAVLHSYRITSTASAWRRA